MEELEEILIFQEFFLDLYNRTFILAHGDIEQINKRLSEKLGAEDEYISGGSLGTVDKFTGNDLTIIVIYLSDISLTTFNLGTIAHESVHAATEVFKHNGIEHDPNNEEPYAYLVDWIVRQVLGVINEYVAERQT